MWLLGILVVETIFILLYIRASYFHLKSYGDFDRINIFLRDLLVLLFVFIYYLYCIFYTFGVDVTISNIIIDIVSTLAIFIFLYSEGYFFEFQKLEYWLTIYFGFGFTISLYLLRLVFFDNTFYLPNFDMISHVQVYGSIIILFIVSLNHIYAAYKFKKKRYKDFISLFIINLGILFTPTSRHIQFMNSDVEMIKSIILFALIIVFLPRMLNLEFMTHLNLYMISISSKNGDFFYILNFLKSKISNKELVPFVASSFNALENFSSKQPIKMIHMANYTIFSNNDEIVNIFIIIDRPTKIIHTIFKRLNSPKLAAIVDKEIFHDDYEMQKSVIRSLIQKAFYPYTKINTKNDFIYRIE